MLQTMLGKAMAKACRVAGPSCIQLFPALEVSISSRSERSLLRQCHECKVIYEFENSDDINIVVMEGIRTKTEYLQELKDDINVEPLKLTKEVHKQLVQMVRLNVLRPIPRSVFKPHLYEDSKKAECISDPAWPHLQLVYEIFLEFLRTSGMNRLHASEYIDTDFVDQLLDLFDSADRREREILKDIIREMCIQFSWLKLYIIRQIEFIFLHFIYETERHNGITELLQLVDISIDDWLCQRSVNYQEFLLKIIIPLHKVRLMTRYHKELTSCVLQLIRWDGTLANYVIHGLLDYWPTAHSDKEVIYLGELAEILNIIHPIQFQWTMDTLFKQIAGCVTSSNCFVAEKALLLWKSHTIRSLIDANFEAIGEIMIPAVKAMAGMHWNESVSVLGVHVLEYFMNPGIRPFVMLDDC